MISSECIDMYRNAQSTFFFIDDLLLFTVLAWQHLLRLSDFHVSVSLGATIIKGTCHESLTENCKPMYKYITCYSWFNSSSLYSICSKQGLHMYLSKTSLFLIWFICMANCYFKSTVWYSDFQVDTMSCKCVRTCKLYIVSIKLKNFHITLILIISLRHMESMINVLPKSNMSQIYFWQ
jgi:hypothetical protein